jgi:hypothetical protein
MNDADYSQAHNEYVNSLAAHEDFELEDGAPSYGWQKAAAEEEALKRDLTALLAYNWQDEERDYYEQNPDERSGHIFTTMRRINDWLNG